MRAESAVVREMLMAPTRIAGGMVAPISAFRITRSEERTAPASVAITRTWTGVRTPARMRIVSAAARVA
jgi:hypothetical protein